MFKINQKRRIVNDAIFVVGKEKQKLYGNKRILSLHPDFDTLFRKVYGVEEEIYFPDLNPDGFETMLNFLQTLETKFPYLDVAWNTLQCAQHFKLLELIFLCNDYICNNAVFNISTVPSLYEKAIQYNIPMIKFRCKKVFDEEIQSLMSSDEFLKLSPNLLKLIVRSQTLNIKSEYELYTAVVKWAYNEIKKTGLKRNRENVKKVLGEIIPHIRFMLMTSEELVCVLENKIMTYNEISAYLCKSIKPTTTLVTCTTLCQYEFKRKPLREHSKCKLDIIPLIGTCSNDSSIPFCNLPETVEGSFTFSLEVHSGEMLLLGLSMNFEPNAGYIIFDSIILIKKTPENLTGVPCATDYFFSESYLIVQPELSIYLKSLMKLDFVVKYKYQNIISPKEFILNDSKTKDQGLKFAIKNQSKDEGWPICKLLLSYAN